MIAPSDFAEAVLVLLDDAAALGDTETIGRLRTAFGLLSDGCEARAESVRKRLAGHIAEAIAYEASAERDIRNAARKIAAIVESAPE